MPTDAAEREAACEEVLAITATGLMRRLRSTGATRVVLGLSGGLDSALALLIAVRAFDLAGLPRQGIEALSLPGPGSSARTRHNAQALAEALDVSFAEIDISAALAQHLSDLGHAPDLYDIAYENAQARERTQLLMDRSNMRGGFMLGTGDLSENALGWCTYAGDQTSNYGLLSGIPKTLVRYVVAYAAEVLLAGSAGDVLADIGATPISPELLPAAMGGQHTEQLLGPYVLHDFFIYHFLRTGAGPRRLALLAELAFAGQYDRVQIVTTLRVFISRFFVSQFKRDAQPNGPKVGTVALSPRGDWRMPSDASAVAWLAELDQYESES